MTILHTSNEQKTKKAALCSLPLVSPISLTQEAEEFEIRQERKTSFILFIYGFVCLFCWQSVNFLENQSGTNSLSEESQQRQNAASSKSDQTFCFFFFSAQMWSWATFF